MYIGGRWHLADRILFNYDVIPELDLFSFSCRRSRQWRTGNLVNLRGIVAASGARTRVPPLSRSCLG